MLGDLFNYANQGKVIGIGKRIEVVGDDDRGRVVGLIDPPTFCGPITEEEINAAFEGRWQYGDDWDPKGHNPDAANPEQCEANRQYDLATGKWFRESPMSALKNLGAGIVNGLIPGSDLGDSWSSTQVLGQLIGGVGSLFVNPTNLVGGAFTKLANMSLGSTLGNAINFVNKTFSGPIGSIATNFVGGLLAPTPAIPAPALKSIYTQAQPQNLAESRPLSFAQQQIFGSTPATKQSLVVDTGSGSSKTPVWMWVVGGLSLLATIVTLVLTLGRKRRRR